MRLCLLIANKSDRSVPKAVTEVQLSEWAKAEGVLLEEWLGARIVAAYETERDLQADRFLSSEPQRAIATWELLDLPLTESAKEVLRIWAIANRADLDDLLPCLAGLGADVVRTERAVYVSRTDVLEPVWDIVTRDRAWIRSSSGRAVILLHADQALRDAEAIMVAITTDAELCCSCGRVVADRPACSWPVVKRYIVCERCWDERKSGGGS